MLKPKQRKCIEMLIESKHSQAEIARQLKISEQTICNWKKNEEFVSEYNELNRICINSLVPKATHNGAAFKF